MSLKRYLAQNRNKWHNQYDFAKALDISPSTLSSILNGKNKPSKTLALRIENITEGAISRFSFFEELAVDEDDVITTGSPLPADMVDDFDLS